MTNVIHMLRPGDKIRVRFGAKGTQTAIVHDITRAGNVRVKKYSAKSMSWTKPVRLYPSELIEVLAVA